MSHDGGADERVHAIIARIRTAGTWPSFRLPAKNSGRAARNMRLWPGVRIGLRLQILLLVAGLLVLAFGSLLWVQIALARLSVNRVERRAGLELGRSVAEAELSGLNIKSNWKRGCWLFGS